MFSLGTRLVLASSHALRRWACTGLTGGGAAGLAAARHVEHGAPGLGPQRGRCAGGGKRARDGRAELVGERGHVVRMPRGIGKIHEFPRIDVVIVEFATALPLVPLRVSPPWRP